MKTPKPKVVSKLKGPPSLYDGYVVNAVLLASHINGVCSIQRHPLNIRAPRLRAVNNGAFRDIAPKSKSVVNFGKPSEKSSR